VLVADFEGAAVPAFFAVPRGIRWLSIVSRRHNLGKEGGCGGSGGSDCHGLRANGFVHTWWGSSHARTEVEESRLHT